MTLYEIKDEQVESTPADPARVLMGFLDRNVKSALVRRFDKKLR